MSLGSCPLMKSLPRKILTAVVSAGVALLVVGLWWASQDAGSSIGLVDNTVMAQDLLESREQSRLAKGPRSISAKAPTAEERSSLTSDQASSIFSIPDHTFVHDTHTYYRFKPDIELVRNWAEHPDGKWLLKTNSLGLREDEETDLDGLAGFDRFVLLAGDSHTDGLCNNSEAFAQLVEDGLEARSPEQRVEVLNTGTSGFNFFNYLGALDKFLPYSPDTFIVTIYGGNDYLGNVMPQHFFAGTAPKPRFESYWVKMREATKVSSAAVGMALNQAYFFQHYPDEMEVAMEASLALTKEIQRICREHEIKLVWVYIPPLYDVDEARAEEMDRAREVLDLSNYDMSVADRLTDAVLEQARSEGDPIVDLRTEFKGRTGPFYWRDGHINLKSHRLVAELLLPLL